MKINSLLSRRHTLALLCAMASGCHALAQNRQSNSAPAKEPRFDGDDYFHRWSKAGQHEFTPKNDTDLNAWRDMVTINVHRNAADGDGMARMANGILGNYRRHGRLDVSFQ